MLSDLGYALLQTGNIAAARLPLMQAAELAPNNRKVISNLALFLMVSGDPEKARDVIAQAKIPNDVRTEIHRLAADMTQKNNRIEYRHAQTTQVSHDEGTVQLQLQRSLLKVVPADEVVK